MCGIAGQVCRPNEQTFENLAVYRDMQAEMKRRGPDQEGILFDKNAVLIHSRLSVMDPENGLQPMRLEFYGEEFDIVYNGEIYNADELRRELISLGHSFSTRCDTEVLLDNLCFGDKGAFAASACPAGNRPRRTYANNASWAGENTRKRRFSRNIRAKARRVRLF